MIEWLVQEVMNPRGRLSSTNSKFSRKNVKRKSSRATKSSRKKNITLKKGGKFKSSFTKKKKIKNAKDGSPKRNPLSKFSKTTPKRKKTRKLKENSPQTPHRAGKSNNFSHSVSSSNNKSASAGNKNTINHEYTLKLTEPEKIFDNVSA